MHFPGIIPAVITPFTAEDTVDVAGLQANAAHVLEHGARGLVAAGTMGEAGALSADERRAVIEAIVAQAGERPGARRRLGRLDRAPRWPTRSSRARPASPGSCASRR